MGVAIEVDGAVGSDSRVHLWQGNFLKNSLAWRQSFSFTRHRWERPSRKSRAEIQTKPSRLITPSRDLCSHEATPHLLLSWNFKHLANVRREGLIAAVNRQEGYWHTLRLLSPLEVEDESQT